MDDPQVVLYNGKDPAPILGSFYAAEIRYVDAGGAQADASFTEMAAYLHPEVVLHQGPSVPFSGDWVGADGVERFFHVFSETWLSLELSERHYYAGSAGVAISQRMAATARATGRHVNTRVAHVIHFDNELIRDWTVFYLDPATVTAAIRP